MGTSRDFTRIHLTQFHRLNKILSPDFGEPTDSYVMIQSEIRSMYVLIRFTYILYDN